MATDLARSFEDAGVAAIIYTDIDRDGAMQGPNIEATEALARAVTIPVIASGGVSRMEDLIALRDTGVIAGAISGRALYDGAIDLAAALKGEPSRPIFPTCLETEDEIILGTDDRHLNFRIGLIRQGGRLYMSTWVHPHNRWGRAYLRLVMPFHILISRGAVARMATRR
jgi:tRNA-dihydrouridine synthase